MSSILSSFVVFYIFFAFQGETLATKNGYIVFELEKIVCENSSSAISECSGFLDYDIPDLRNVSFSANLSELLDFRNKTLPSIIDFLQLFSSGECRKSLTTYYCNFAYPFRCKEDYIEFETAAHLAAKCNDSKNVCSNQLPFNCSSTPGNNTQNTPLKIPVTLKCEKFPDLKDDPYTCITNYEVGQNVYLKLILSQFEHTEILIYIPA